jgi:hypothetical protein
METPESTPEEATPEEQQEGNGDNGGEGKDPAFDPSQARDDPPGAQQ